MFIYTFVAHPDKEWMWGYAVIIARSFSHAVEVYQEPFPLSRLYNPKLAEKKVPLTSDSDCVLVLVSEIPVRVDELPRIVHFNWGYTE